jgi:hypothetical protein
MKTNCSITVRGRRKTWSIPLSADPAHLKDWQDDGVNVQQVFSHGPIWLRRFGLTRVWCRAQDVWQLLRLW